MLRISSGIIAAAWIQGRGGGGGEGRGRERRATRRGPTLLPLYPLAGRDAFLDIRVQLNENTGNFDAMLTKAKEVVTRYSKLCFNNNSE